MVPDPSIAVTMVKILEEEMGEIVRSSHKLMMCARKTGEKTEGWTDEMIDVKIDGWTGEKTDEPIAKWTGARIGRWTIGRIIDQMLAANSVGSIVQTMLPRNTAEREETMLA